MILVILGAICFRWLHLPLQSRNYIPHAQEFIPIWGIDKHTT